MRLLLVFSLALLMSMGALGQQGGGGAPAGGGTAQGGGTNGEAAKGGAPQQGEAAGKPGIGKPSSKMRGGDRGTAPDNPTRTPDGKLPPDRAGAGKANRGKTGAMPGSNLNRQSSGAVGSLKDPQFWFDAMNKGCSRSAMR